MSVTTSNPETKQPRAGGRRKVFVRLLSRAALVPRGRSLTALLAVVVAASVATAVLNIYVDVQAKLRKEFRSYGANIVVLGNSGASLPPDALARVDALLAGRGAAVPFAYIVARTADGSPVVVAGTDMQRARKVNGWWSVSAWPEGGTQGLLGMRAAAMLSPEGKPFELSFQGRKVQVSPAGTLHTGAAEDSRVYLPLASFVNWTGVAPSTVEVAVSGSASDIDAMVQSLSNSLPTAEVRPVRQIVEGEERVLGKTRSALLASALVIILTAGLCLLATLTARVLDQRRNFAIMKALGASERLVNGLFAAEAAGIGIVGAVVGYGVGSGVAAWIGRANFHAAIAPRISVFPWVLAGSLAVALISAVVPIGLLRRVQPAVILRGE
jgi:putative ABC transport system permease protein